MLDDVPDTEADAEPPIASGALCSALAGLVAAFCKLVMSAMGAMGPTLADSWGALCKVQYKPFANTWCAVCKVQNKSLDGTAGVA